MGKFPLLSSSSARDTVVRVRMKGQHLKSIHLGIPVPASLSPVSLKDKMSPSLVTLQGKG